MNNIAIFASGNGSNAQAIITYFREHSTRSRVSLVVTNRPDAYVVARASDLGVETLCWGREVFCDSPEVVVSALSSRNIGFVVLAGFMLLIPPQIINSFRGRIINIHPSLLPEFGGRGMYGDRVHRAVIDSGERVSGISIHLIDEHYDRGDLIFQAQTALCPGETPESLAQKIHALEHYHYPRVIERLIETKE
ncbi:MAG: phosphoribosylglycinamide formyltransferase [Rikenellaceae bacterium]